MECLNCGLNSGYNRAVVDLLSGICLGGLCFRCEEREFGTTLTRTERTADECVLCPRDGGYALPEWKPYSEEAEDGTLHAGVDYDLDDTAVLLCDEHLQLVNRNRTAVSTDAERSAGKR